jgi:hypothetical protein
MLRQLALAIVLVLSVFLLPAQAVQTDYITMLVVPRDVIPIQIGQDISRRYPVLLVSYQLTRGRLKLHAWNGDSWVAVPVEDYTNGTFFATRPKRAILVESEQVRAPDLLIPSSIWCENASRLTSADPRVMLHLLGLYFDFSFSNWEQLAKRYGYSIDQINPTLKNVHWWNFYSATQSGANAQRDFSADLTKWLDIKPLPPPPIAPAAEAEKLPVVKPATPKPITSGVTAVEIPVKVPVAIPAPVIEPTLKSPAKVVPAPVVEPAPKTPIPVPAPVLEPAPKSPFAELPAGETPAPVVEAETVLAAPVPEPVVTNAPGMRPAPAIEADPFSTEEIPAAEIIIPQAPKKPWWKLF